MKLSVLIDNGIISRSNFAKPAVQDKTINWGPRRVSVPLHGFKRKLADSNPAQQAQIDLIYTIGRLVRENQIQAFNSQELQVEAWRGSGKIPICNSFEGCKFFTCNPPIERSKFRSTTSFENFLLKGGKKDVKRQKNITFSQLTFVKWLLSLSSNAVLSIKNLKEELKLNNFELDSFDDLDWVKLLSKKLMAPDELMDAFHLWTAERNNIEVFLTLDCKFANKIKQIKSEKKCEINIKTEVLRPIELLSKIGIKTPDRIPLEYREFYSL